MTIEYDDDRNYYPKSSSKKENRTKSRTNNMRAPIADDEDNMAMINASGDGDYYDDDESNRGGDYARPSMIIDREHDTYEYRARSAIYPKPNLRYGAKNTYDNGRWANETNDKWFDFVYNDYLHWITQQYLSKNLHPDLKRVFVHVTTV